MAETDSRILEYLEEGLFLYGVGKVQESIVRWRKVLELDPKNERAMDYIESAGGDVSQYRAKAGLPPKGAAPASAAPPVLAPQPPKVPAPAAAKAPAPAAAPPPSAAPAAPPVVPPSAPLDIGAFLEATGTAPPGARAQAASPAPTPAPAPASPARRQTLPPPMMSGAMPWQVASVTATASAVTSPSVDPPPPATNASVTAASPSLDETVTAPSMAPLELDLGPDPAPPQPAPQPAPQAQPQPAPQPQPQPAPASPRQELVNQAGALFQARQYEQSLEILERVARDFPPVDDQLRGYMEAARNALYEVLKAQWPSPTLVPEIRMSPQQVMQLKLSPEAGFIFSRIDGVSTVEEILSMGGLDPFTTLRALSQLVRAGVVTVQA